MKSNYLIFSLSILLGVFFFAYYNSDVESAEQDTYQYINDIPTNVPSAVIDEIERYKLIPQGDFSVNSKKLAEHSMWTATGLQVNACRNIGYDLEDFEDSELTFTMFEAKVSCSDKVLVMYMITYENEVACMYALDKHNTERWRGGPAPIDDYKCHMKKS